MKFKVGLVQSVTEGLTIYVEANSREEAEKLALEQANAGQGDWRFLDTEGEVEVVSVDQETLP
jgi:hypothetical protein